MNHSDSDSGMDHTRVNNGSLAPQAWPSLGAEFSSLQRHPMTVRDLDAVVSIEVRAYSHPWSHGNFVDSLAVAYRAEVWRVDAVAVPGGHQPLVGYFVAMPGVDELHLLNITVAPEWQGRGVGHALLDAVQAHAREQSLATLWLEVRESNHRARALYRRRGFSEVALRRGYYPGGPVAGRREDAVVMSLPVAATDSPRVIEN